MAYPTVSAAYGFKPYNLMGGRDYAGSTRMIPIAEAYGTNLFNGDLVQLGGTNKGSLIQSTIAYNTAAAVAGTIGVFVGCEYSTASSTGVATGPIYGKNRFQYWPASQGAEDAVAYVVDDQYAVFRVAVLAQLTAGASNTLTAIGYVSEAFVGSNVSAATGQAGSTATGDSAWGVTSSTAPTNNNGVVRTTTTLPFRIVQLVPDTAVTVVQTGTSSGTTVTLSAANTAIQPGMQVIVPTTTTGYVAAGHPADYNYVTNVNGTAVTINTAITQASSVPIVFVGYPEVLVAWNFGYHSYQQAAGV